MSKFGYVVLGSVFYSVGSCGCLVTSSAFRLCMAMYVGGVRSVFGKKIVGPLYCIVCSGVFFGPCG